MTPTAKLRWVERDMAVSLGDILYGTTQKVNVLQQWWSCEDGSYGEWRDVPLEEEA